MNKNFDPEKMEKAIKMVEFAVEMCIAQHRAGRLFVFEHPLSASSWKLPCLERLASLPGMRYAVFDMCRFGMKQEDKEGK